MIFRLQSYTIFCVKKNILIKNSDKPNIICIFALPKKIKIIVNNENNTIQRSGLRSDERRNAP